MVKKHILYVLIWFFVLSSISLVKGDDDTGKDFIILHQLYGQKKLIVDVDIKINLMMTDEVNVELSSAQTGLIEKRKIKPMSYLKPEHRKYQTVFDMKKLSNGVYSIKVVVRDEYGDKLMDESVKEFTWLSGELEQFKWLNSKEGISEEVLAPWTPVEVNRQKDGKNLIVKVWGRAYQFNNSSFPTSIETKGKSILAAPIRVIAKVDGKNVTWQWNSPKIDKQIPSIVSFIQDASGYGLNLSARTQIEYDGMIRIDWKITTNQALELEELTFEIPILAKYAKYVYHSGYTGKVGFIYKDRWVRAFEPMIWFGDEDIGLEWFCESKKDWYNISPNRRIEILPESEVVMLRLHLVNKAIHMGPGVRISHESGVPIMQSLDKVVELSYTFGLQATPVKPVTQDVWDYRLQVIGGTGGTELWTAEQRFPSESSIKLLAESGAKTGVLFEYWTNVHSYTSTPYGEFLKKCVKDSHKHGINVLVYLGFLMGDIIPEYPLFNEECVKIPRGVSDFHNYPPSEPHTSFFVCYRSVWSDFLADGIARLIDEYDIDGVYLDSTAILFGGCKNTLHGCGYIDLNGEVIRTYAIFPNREIMKRIYTIVKKRKPYGQVNDHNSTEMLAPVMSWATSYWDGEHLGERLNQLGISKTAALFEQLPLDQFRTEFMGYQWGIPAELLEWALFKDPWEALALSLLHDVPIRSHVMFPIWKLMDEFGRKESEWLAYWKNSEYVTISPEGTNVYVSLYKHPKNGVLAMVSNLGKDEAKVNVQLNLKNLKFKEELNAFNAISKKPVSITNGRFEQKLRSGGFKIIWIKE